VLSSLFLPQRKEGRGVSIHKVRPSHPSLPPPPPFVVVREYFSLWLSGPLLDVDELRVLLLRAFFPPPFPFFPVWKSGHPVPMFYSLFLLLPSQRRTKTSRTASRSSSSREEIRGNRRSADRLILLLLFSFFFPLRKRKEKAESGRKERKRVLLGLPLFFPLREKTLLRAYPPPFLFPGRKREGRTYISL